MPGVAETDVFLTSRLACSKKHRGNQDYPEEPRLQKQQQKVFIIMHIGYVVCEGVYARR